MELKNTVKAVALMTIAISGLSSCTSKTPEKKEIGLALYSIKDLPENLDSALQSISEIGYTNVEISNYQPGQKPFGLTPEALKTKVESYGLHLLSSNTNGAGLNIDDPEQCLASWDQVFADHEAMGCTYLAQTMNFGWGGPDRVMKFCNLLNKIGEIARKHNVQYLYHCHNMEYNLIDSTDTPVIDFLLANTDKNLVNIEFDVYWAMQGGVDPVAFLAKYPDRIPVLHVKDYYLLGKSGKIDFEAIFNQFYANGFRDFFVEMEDDIPMEEADAKARGMWGIAVHPINLEELMAKHAEAVENPVPQEPKTNSPAFLKSVADAKSCYDYLNSSAFVR